VNSFSTPPDRPAPYPKWARLRKDRDFLAVRNRGRRVTGSQCQVRVVQNELGRPRLGLATPKKYGNAVRRNRFRRLARTAFRLLGRSLGARDLLVEPRRGLGEPSLEGILQDLRAAAGIPKDPA